MVLVTFDLKQEVMSSKKIETKTCGVVTKTQFTVASCTMKGANFKVLF